MINQNKDLTEAANRARILSDYRYGNQLIKKLNRQAFLHGVIVGVIGSLFFWSIVIVIFL